MTLPSTTPRPMTVRVGLPDRVRDALSGVKDVQEKQMFGSAGFMVRGKLCMSARESGIMCRIDPALREDLLARKGCRPLTMRGREYRGYVRVDAAALKTEKDLRFWVRLALDYNASLTETGRRR